MKYAKLYIEKILHLIPSASVSLSKIVTDRNEMVNQVSVGSVNTGIQISYYEYSLFLDQQLDAAQREIEQLKGEIKRLNTHNDILKDPLADFPI